MHARFHGKTFAEMVTWFSNKRTAREVKIVRYAQDNYSKENEHEIDDDAILSEGDDNGTYVMSWTWVPFDETEWDKGEN